MKTTVKLTINKIRFFKDRNWRDLQVCKSNLQKALEELSTKSEEELTKKDLLYLISVNCDVMHALNLYNYYKDLLSQALVSKSEDKAD